MRLTKRTPTIHGCIRLAHLLNIPKCHTDELWDAVKHGVWLYSEEIDTTEPVVALANGEIKCLYQLMENKTQYKPLKMFSTQ